MVSSSVYLFNDLRDLENDKLHPRKRLRPIASGRLPYNLAFAMAVDVERSRRSGDIGRPSRTSRCSSRVLSEATSILNFFYILRLKQVVILDAMALSMGFVLRVLGGAAIIGVPGVGVASPLHACSSRSFLPFPSVATSWCCSKDGAKGHREVLEHYSPHLLDQIIAVVTTSTLVSYLLYTIDPRTQEKFDGMHLIYTVPFVLYGIFRYLYLVHKKGEGGSPTRALLTDRPLLGNVMLWVIVTLAILYRQKLPFF